MSRLKRSHRFTISVTFDEPVAKADGLREVRYVLKDEDFYIGSLEPGYPDHFKIRGVASAPNRRGK